MERLAAYIDKNKKWLVLIVVIATVQAFLNIGIIVSENIAHDEEIRWPFYFINEFTGIYCGLILIPFLIWFFRAYPLTKEKLPGTIVLYLLASLVFGALWTSIMYGTRLVIYPMAGIARIGEVFNDLPFRYLMEYFKQFFVFWLIYYIYWSVRQYRNNQERILKESRLHGELSKARLNSLQMQLQPHFFFNTLNTVSSIMYSDPGRADNLITRMSDFLREVIQTRDSPLHPLEQEIELLKKYTDIMLARYGDKLDIRYNLSSKTLQCLVPVLLLQPLVENSIKYAIDHKKNTVVKIESKRENNVLKLEISDNGPGVDEDNLKYGTGLSLTTMRLRNLYESVHTFSIYRKKNGGTLVSISFLRKQPKWANEY